MSLRDLLYRCPHCGQDPVEGRKDRVRCPECGSAFQRGDRPAGIRVVAADAKPRTVPARRLVEAIEKMGGPFPAARTEEGDFRYESRVRFRRGTEEEAVRHRNRLLGFVETLGKLRNGNLRLLGEALELIGAEDGEVRSRWNLMDLRAVQSSSSSLQVYTATAELVEFRLADASPVRWEALLHGALRRAYRRQGRGEIVEFQPRITVR